jgi:hypothetical protein
MARPRLTFLVHRGKDYTFRHYFKSWGAELRERVEFKTYPGVAATGRTLSKRLSRRLKSWRTGTLSFRQTPLPGSIYAFTDLEILAAGEVELVERLAGRLRDRQGTTILNDPSRSLTRFDLLRALYDAGINSFDVGRIDRGSDPGRWPVFVRDDRSHDDGSVSELLHSPEELSRHLAELAASGADTSHHTLVEYAGTTNDGGLFRKYAAVRLGEAIIPCHIFYGRQWVVKHSAVFDEASAREELEYIETNPHEEILRRAFDLAGIDYGRADYGVVDGRVEIWEINTNPYLIRPEYTRQEARREALAAFSERFNAALQMLLDR